MRMKWKTEFLDSVCERGSTHFGYLDEIVRAKSTESDDKVGSVPREKTVAQGNVTCGISLFTLSALI